MYRFGAIDPIQEIQQLKIQFMGGIKHLEAQIEELKAGGGGSSAELDCLIQALRDELKINIGSSEFGNRRMMARRRGRPKTKRGRGRGRRR